MAILRFACIVFYFIVSLLPSIGQPSTDDIYRLDLTSLYANDSLWEGDYTTLQGALKNYDFYQSIFPDSSQYLLQYLTFEFNIKAKIDQLYMYGVIGSYISVSNTSFQEKLQRMEGLLAQVESQRKIVTNRLISLPEDTIPYLLSQPDLYPYKHLLTKLFREKAYALIDLQQEVVGALSALSFLPSNSYNELTQKDFRQSFAHKPDTTLFIEHNHTHTAIYNSHLAYQKFLAQIRGFEDTRSSYLFKENMSPLMYANLIDSSIHTNSPLHRWVSLKAAQGGSSSIAYIDLLKGKGNERPSTLSYQKAIEQLPHILAPLGDTYISLIDSIIHHRWIDVFPSTEKYKNRNVTFSILGHHPYIMMNWMNQIENLKVLIHELGHAANIALSEKKQPLHYAEICSFNPEIPSNLNEILFFEYQIAQAKTKEEKCYAIELYINKIVSSFYVQNLLAEMEYTIAMEFDKKGVITSYFIEAESNRLFRLYFGESLALDATTRTLWDQSFHKYLNYYYYNYGMATSIAIQLYQQLNKEPSQTQKRIFTFLEAGSYAYPNQILQELGIDLESPTLHQATLVKMNELIDLYEITLNKN